MKKSIISVILLMLVVALVGCNGKNGGDNGGTPNKKGDIVITYAAWNLATPQEYNIERRMINAFMVENPGVTVEVIERPKVADEEGNEQDVPWDEFFATRASVNEMPDVFQVNQVTKVVSQGWVEDVTELAEADEDFMNVPENIRNTCYLGNKAYSLPQAVFYFGYFINRTAINNTGSGAIIPKYGITYQDLMAAAKKNSKPAVLGGDAINGIQGVNNLFEWLPAQIDKTLGWYTYNETGYHLDSDAFRIAMTENQKYFGPNKNEYASYVYETQENREDLYGTGDAFANGKQSIRWGGSYNIRGWVGGTTNPEHALYGHDVDFIGTPSWEVDGVKNHRIPVVMDYIGVGKGTKHKEIAFKFAKWMGYGADGFRKRIEIATAHPEAGAINFAPVVRDQALMDAYFELYPTMTEYRKVVENHQDFIIESLHKIVPGYIESRWNGQYDAENTIDGILQQIKSGELALADALAAGLNTRVNDEWDRAKRALDEILGK
ncbi:MAG: ABC transporter substrate-binding protein [Acholeplasmataceae bacterium]